MIASNTTDRDITISIVSHGQNRMVNALLSDMDRLCADRITVVITQNIEDEVPLALASLRFPVETLRNAAPKGYGANNNAAFRLATTRYFCVSNPDIRLAADPFAHLIACLRETGAAVAGPAVVTPDGTLEDSARRFPTLPGLLRKAAFGTRGPDYPARERIGVDWIAGMFMLFDSAAYRSAGGFDERYFLYYEDVDFCRRLRRSGREVCYVPECSVVHDAQRASHRSLRLAWLHFTSMLRFLVRS